MGRYILRQFSDEIIIRKPEIRLKDGYSHSESHSSVSSYDSEDPENNYEINRSESHGSHEDPEEDINGFITDPETGEEVEFDN